MEKKDFPDFVKFRVRTNPDFTSRQSTELSRVNLTGLTRQIIATPELWTRGYILARTIKDIHTRLDGQPINQHAYTVYWAETQQRLYELYDVRSPTTHPKQRDQIWKQDYVKTIFEFTTFRNSHPSGLVHTAYQLNPNLTIAQIIEINQNNIDQLNYIRRPKKPTNFVNVNYLNYIKKIL